MLSRAEIKGVAKERIKGNVWKCFGIYLLAMIVTEAGALAFGIGAIITMPLMLVGLSIFFLNIYRAKESGVENLFDGFKKFGLSMSGIWLVILFTWLWSLLFIIPGIIKSFAYSMTPYIIADCDDITGSEALKRSMRITKGYKGKIFVMQLSFFWWCLLVSVTFGIAGVYVLPYMYASMAGMYDELKKNAQENGTW